VQWLRRLFHNRPSTLELAEFFDDASRDEEHFPSTIDPRIYHVKLVQRHLGELQNKRIADIGCGKGRFARVLAAAEPRVRIVAVDISLGMLRHVPPELPRCAASITAIPLANECCDGTYATESLEHAIDIQTAVAEICRIVKPGGRIVIIDKNAEQWGRLETPPWEKWFHRSELEKLLKRHCREVSSQFISYWEDVEPDGLFIAWLAVK
jgi:ubiquinone/menaquinone biosynthesis C-methylase UbiE